MVQHVQPVRMLSTRVPQYRQRGVAQSVRVRVATGWRLPVLLWRRCVLMGKRWQPYPLMTPAGAVRLL